MVTEGNWCYMVIRFKKDCKYHYHKELNNPNKEFKYQFTQRISNDICSNLNYLRNNLIKYNNQNITGSKIRWNPNVDYDFPEPNDPPLRYVSKLKRSDLRFIGILEYNPVFTQKKLKYNTLHEDVGIGTHVHLFIKNNTHLTPLQIFEDMFLMNPKHQNWKGMIDSATSPQVCNIDFYQADHFINYHLKQLHGDFQLIVPDEQKTRRKNKNQTTQ